MMDEHPPSVRVLIFQNYFTPYRFSLFEALSQKGVQLTVVYAHRGQDEGRSWDPIETKRFIQLQLPHIRIGKIVFFWVPFALIRHSDVIVILDNNPTNISMILWASLFRLASKRIYTWVEHIPDRNKSRAKRHYQTVCSRLLLALSNRALSFSRATNQYLLDIGYGDAPLRMIQAVPMPPSEEAGYARLGQIRSFGYLGSNAPRKNVGSLIDAFSKLKDPSLELHIAGFEGSSTDTRIHWHGYVDGCDRERFFGRVDVLILPSHADPWGLVVNEAMMRGRIAVASSGCGSSELTGEASELLICAPTAPSIFHTLEALANLPETEANKLRARCAALVLAYSIESASSLLRGYLHTPEPTPSHSRI